MVAMKKPVARKSSPMIVLDTRVGRGKPIIAGTRIPVLLVLEMLSTGSGERGVLRKFPTLTRAEIRACREYGARLKQQQAAEVLRLLD